jgi:MFS transporter, DHA2 family, multidrug resistance protein
VGMDSYVLVTALPTLSAKLGASTSELQWISASYTLAWACVLLPAGRLGDRFGRRRLLIAGLSIFGISSVLASQATTVGMLIAMRGLMGVGSAVIMPLSLSMLPIMFSGKDQTRAVTITTLAAMLGLPLGPLAAGYLLSHFYWGSVFLINPPIVVLAILSIWFRVPESKDPGRHPLEWPGAALSIAGITSLVYGIIEGPIDGWGSPTVAACIAAGIVLLAIFAIHELRARNPLIDLHIFSNMRFTFAAIASAAVSFALAGMLFLLTPFLQIVQHTGAEGTGVRLLPLISGVIVGGAASSLIVSHYGSKVTLALGLGVTCAGQIVLGRLHVDSSYVLIGAALAIFGIGQGLTFPTAMDTVLAALPKAQTGAGSGLARSVQSLGTALGVAILGSVLNAVYRSRLTDHAAALAAPLRSAARPSIAAAQAAAQRLPRASGTTLFRVAADAYSTGLAYALAVSSGLLILAGVLVLAFLPSRPPEAEDQDAGTPGEYQETASL